MTDEYYYDEESAERPILWIEKYCRLSGGKPFRLEEYQKRDIIRPMFGWKRSDDHTFKHRFCYIEMGKGNGKSGLLSALAAYLCFAAGEENAEIYAIASDRKQAGIVHNGMKEIVLAHPELARRCDVLRDTVLYRDKANRIVAVSSDVGGSHGWRPYAVILDELHTYKDSELYNSYTAGLIKRRNSMAFILTTAGKRGTFAEEIHDKALAIRDGRDLNPYWHVAIYAAHPDDPPFEVETIKKANPAYGTLIRAADFDLRVREAQSSPSMLASYKQLHLNIWTGKMEDWITTAEWRSCALGIPEEEYKELPCWGGLDIAQVRDMTAFALMWRLPDGRVVWRSWFWIPEGAVVAREKMNDYRYRDWVSRGLVRMTDGNAQDHPLIADQIAAMCQTYNVQYINFDRIGMLGFIEAFNRFGIKIEGHGQGYYGMSAPAKEMERLIIKQQLDHAGNEVLDWMAGGCKICRDPAGNIKFDKSDPTHKIDGIVAGAMALSGVMSANTTPELPDDWVPEFV